MKWHSPHRKRNKNKRCNISNKMIVRKIKNGTSISASKKQINRRRFDVPQITINPLTDFPHFFEGSPQKTFKPTFEVLNNLSKGGKYNISLNYESLDNGKQQAIFPLKINQSNSKGINFEINLPNNFICRGVRSKESYGLDSPLKIYNDRSSFYIERGCVTNFETTFPRRPLSIRGNFKRIQTFEKLEDSAFLRCLISTIDKDMIFPGDFLDCVHNCILFDIDSLSLHTDSIIGIPMPSTKGHYSELNINGCNILFYGIEVKNKYCLVIDSIDKIQINDFEKIVYAMRLVYAFFTGRFYKEEKIILTSSKSKFDAIENFSYEMEEESIITDLQIVDFELFRQLINEEEDPSIKEEYNKHRKGIKQEIFSSMCNRVLSSVEFKRVLELTTSGWRINDPIIQGALYSVALETLTQIIYDENAETLAPIPKELFKKMRSEFMGIFSSYEEKMDERGKNIIKTKIQNLNSPTNRDKLEKPFEHVGITLTEEEKIIIGSRNQYLHGGEPENSYEWFLTAQLNALNLFDLTARLILKYAKYEGHYFSPQFKYVLNNEMARDVIEKEVDIAKYREIIVKLNEGKFTKLEDVQKAKDFLAEFVPYIEVLSVLEQKVKLI